MDDSDKIKNFYDDCYADYDLYMNETGHYAAQISLINLLEDKISEPVLDVACGTGILINEILKNVH